MNSPQEYAQPENTPTLQTLPSAGYAEFTQSAQERDSKMQQALQGLNELFKLYSFGGSRCSQNSNLD
jgi:hypothetical protein